MIGKSAHTQRAHLIEHIPHMEPRLSKRNQSIRTHTWRCSNDCSRQAALSVTMIQEGDRKHLDDRYCQFFATTVKTEYVVKKCEAIVLELPEFTNEEVEVREVHSTKFIQ